MALSWPRSSQLVDEKRENRTLTTVFDIWILFEMSFLDFNDGGGKSVEWFLYDNGLRHERVKFIGLCYYLVVLNINFKIELAFQNTNIYRKSKFKGSGSSYKWKFVSSDNHG